MESKSSSRCSGSACGRNPPRHPMGVKMEPKSIQNGRKPRTQEHHETSTWASWGGFWAPPNRVSLGVHFGSRFGIPSGGGLPLSRAPDEAEHSFQGGLQRSSRFRNLRGCNGSCLLILVFVSRNACCGICFFQVVISPNTLSLH